ncbi:hypothetical protein P154DRAFT_602525 [Amniculicola lignicola CBS 123094]|uniref:Histidine kinase HHK8p n=1 Tax=Amniculicola lignicola CBS 123094 TaxID=1392246 RepID=A0A6A5WB91_9PLEO|nr:hypothetical protein P154DRAFT_602525 [Amniculicola lignicola CBS 123094]
MPHLGDPRIIDLEVLEADPAPAFALVISTTALPFDILFSNKALRSGNLRDEILTPDGSALVFQSWAQAVRQFPPRFQFAGWSWTAEVTGRNSTWKIVRAVEPLKGGSKVTTAVHNVAPMHQRKWLTPEEPLHALPQPANETVLSTQLNSIQTMMEMSDVGVFEFEPAGALRHANNAWFRLSSHPKDFYSDYSFMDLVHPEDTDVAMSAWNTLVGGTPITFEMRWKGSASQPDRSQWILTSCVPVVDESGKVVSVVGNTIDINAQKSSEKVAQARVEALEQATMSERKFMRFAQLAPVAIYVFIPNKGMQYLNDKFFELTGHPRVEFEKLNWPDIVYDEDVGEALSAWSSIVEGRKTDMIQFRLKKTWDDREGVRSQVWVQGSSYPELDRDGNVISIMGTLFDISYFKWAESLQSKRVEEALEAKRQQENFIDMTSHELRNPLSAVVQCADSVLATLHQLTLRSANSKLQSVSGEIDSCIDALQTIVTCSLHQKHVIDDVLTLSKFDSNLIYITPMRVQPATVVSEALKLFKVECNQLEISLKFVADDSLRDFEWVMLDPSRLIQILINLVTNAIKFTKLSAVRTITVTLGGSWTERPPALDSIHFTASDKSFHPASRLSMKPSAGALVDNPEWGSGPTGFIWIQVSDTGCGMTREEQNRLFSRFQQATQRTYVKYGGSGLGLFISKSLAALQGGSIGVNSFPNVGSTFAFYVQTRTTEPPLNARKSATKAIGMGDGSTEAMKVAKLNVLLVEDNLVNQKVLSKQLRNAGCKVSTAGNGVEALEWLTSSVHWSTNSITDTENGQDPTQRQGLDVIFMDIEMPIMDGLACTTKIREYEAKGMIRPVDEEHARGARRRIPILAVSANARSEQVKQAIEAGMDDAISKPFRIHELWPKVEGIVPRLANR